jgi:hypothetical protein
MATKALLSFIRRSPLHRYVVGFIAIFTVLSVGSLIVLYPLRAIYYGVVTGDYLLNVQSVTATPEVEQGNDLAVTFCRDPRTRIIAINNIRTFYVDEQNQSVMQRNLPDGIAYERTTDPCQIITIKSEQRPDDLGTYKFCQEFDFYTYYQQLKTVSFCSTSYKVTSPKK